MLSQAALSQLQDIQIPEPITWWPLAAAVWILIIGGLILTIGIGWHYWVSYQSNRYRREAALKFKDLIAKDLNPPETLLAVNQLLKQVAITHYGRLQVSSLSGKKWLTFLQETALYIEQPKSLLKTLQSAYQSNSSQKDPQKNQQKDQEEFLTYSKAWIRGHHK